MIIKKRNFSTFQFDYLLSMTVQLMWLQYFLKSHIHDQIKGFLDVSRVPNQQKNIF